MKMGMKAPTTTAFHFTGEFRNQRYLVGVNLLATPDDFFNQLTCNTVCPWPV